ncbi:uncharacterized protein LOC144180825 isoform X2 [Haemaphysalis longicornis]
MQGDSGCYLYEASGGQHVTLRFTAAGDENLPPPALLPTSACSDGDDGAAGAAALAENEGELWSARKMKFYIAQYTALKDLVGKTRTLWTKKQLWIKITELINKEFLCNMTATQVENKWKSLYRSYKPKIKITLQHFHWPCPHKLRTRGGACRSSREGT